MVTVELVLSASERAWNPGGPIELRHKFKVVRVEFDLSASDSA